MYTEEQKQQIYKKWLANGRPWFHIDPKKEPNYAEKQIIIEIQKREKSRDKELEKSPNKNEIKQFHRLFTDVSNY